MPDNIKKVKKIYFLLIGGLGIFSAILIGAAWYASSIAPKLMTDNYASIQYTRQMERSFISIYISESGGAALDQGQIDLFEQNLNKAKNNITEEGEKESLENLQSRWNAFKVKAATPTVAEFQAIMNLLDDIANLNEKKMFTLNEHAASLGLTIVAGGVMSLVLILLYAFLIADSQFELIAKMIPKE